MYIYIYTHQYIYMYYIYIYIVHLCHCISPHETIKHDGQIPMFVHSMIMFQCASRCPPSHLHTLAPSVWEPCVSSAGFAGVSWAVHQMKMA